MSADHKSQHETSGMSDACTRMILESCKKVDSILRRFNSVSFGLPNDLPLPPTKQAAAFARANLVLGEAGVERLEHLDAAPTPESESESESESDLNLDLDLDLDLDSESESELAELEVVRSAVSDVLHTATVPLARQDEREICNFRLGVLHMCQLEQHLDGVTDNGESDKDFDKILNSFGGRMAVFLFLALPMLAPRELDDVATVERVREQCALLCWNMLPKSTSKYRLHFLEDCVAALALECGQYAIKHGNHPEVEEEFTSFKRRLGQRLEQQDSGGERKRRAHRDQQQRSFEEVFDANVRELSRFKVVMRWFNAETTHPALPQNKNMAKHAWSEPSRSAQTAGGSALC